VLNQTLFYITVFLYKYIKPIVKKNLHISKIPSPLICDISELFVLNDPKARPFYQALDWIWENIMKGSNLRCEPIWHLAALQYKMSILAFTGTVVGKGMLEKHAKNVG
jgi:hypothetical protein